ncbi:unnamed protein product [Penicillium salamii]|uniref:Uncharacterized protein n=1 Tax=Penicillium salamii TaxID=1612424 RepID=A0A9W4IZD2_9EURO|nr:unnamed protein product [Penicillium salamii]CAG8036420.1 unnamed protein product [Penicillium salamii]CAG8055455.1 unnamed protein product [Penicillium salamii]CAG8202637.1 unnamed protein product [Penicillium salamii]CAG8326253.1 unnamed protein product [Penicillium salamii]
MQHLQPAVLPQVIHFTVAKFSHTNTLVDHVGPLNWIHIIGGDLHCVFEKLVDVGSTPSRLILKVLRGDVMLEQVDLVYLTRNMPMPAQLTPTPKSKFAVVVKLPCIAVKYPYNDTHIRRFQIKFATERDYLTALALLSESNCPITESNSSIPATRHVPSVSSWTSGNMSSITPAAVNTATNAHAGSGFRFGPGMIASGGTTPLRASSPASTVSYAPRCGPLLPTIFPPTLNMQPVAMGKPLQEPLPIQDMSYSSQEFPNSQLSTVSAIHDIDQLNQMLPPKRHLPFTKPTAKRPLPANETLQKHTHQEEIPASSQPPQPTIEPACSGFPESQSQNLSQVAGQPTEKQTHEPRPRPAPFVADDQIIEYLASPTPERLVFLENWMCELLEDDNFMTLCQDVEGTWRRFALGQRR